VIAGSARGRALVSPPGFEVRPTTDRARQATFNALESRGLVVDALVVDLFAGSGAMGIEALSRGAARAVLVDSSAEAVRAVRQNISALSFDAQATIVRADALRWLAGSPAVARPEPGQALVVVADPPYAYDAWAALLGAIEPLLLAAGEDGIAVLEGPKPPVLPDGWEVGRQKRYGLAWVTMAWPGPRGG
jgi:16S rRNA (guanine966-N2)-methyltransferase